jgi:glycosyltransferase involved in cell wall biosynthesis|tara:strand:+ start:175 stop:1245 length:1071 start_codon:yes stop_codon:yes gene_type:complete
MKITFIVSGLNLTGGLRVIATYANLLTKRGHDVTVVSPSEKQPTLKEKVKSFLNWKGYKHKKIFDKTFFEHSNYEVKVLDKSGPIKVNDVPDADVIIATFWITAEWLAKFPETKGKKVYFIQHYEIHDWLPIDRVKATFMLPFKKIVVAQWLSETLKNEYQQYDISIVSNAVDHNLFYAPKRNKNLVTTFGMMYSERQYKGSQLAFDAFNKLKMKYPVIRLVAFGTEEMEKVKGLPEDADYIPQPTQNKIREIYSRCDAWLFTSSVEGFGLPILEAMACRSPVIGTRCGAAPDLLRLGGGLLVDIGDIHGLLSAMEKVCIMEATQWVNMSDLAYNKALSYKWEDKAIELERVISSL